MKLYSQQPPAVADLLKAGTTVTADSALIDPHHLTAYDWLVEQMTWRIGPPKRDSIKYPMWAWSPIGEYDAEFTLDNLKGDVLIELDVPESGVLLSDYMTWHSVLNDVPIELYENEAPDKLRSWERIFSVDPRTGVLKLHSPDPEWIGCGKPTTVQATMWAIRPEWVKHYY